MKSITEQATNRINVTGKLLDATFRDGKLDDGRPYESATVTVRVKQTYGGKEEISEVPVSLFAARYTTKNKPNPGFEQIQKLKEFKTVQAVGFDDASIVRVANGNIRENNFVTRSGAQISGWQINTGFINEGKGADVASFVLDIFIMDMHPEEDREGDPTGRLIIKGGVVQYNSNLDVLEFIAEDPQVVDYIERHWNNNDTVTIKGRIRVASQEQKSSGSSSSWGEDVPDVATRVVRELIITTGDDEGKEEDFAYDPVDIKKAFNARKAKIEQQQMDAASKAKPAAAPAASKYSWE